VFRKKQTAQRNQQTVESIGNVPPTAYERARAEWAERNGDSTVNQGRLFVIATVSLLITLAMAVAIASLLPLKEAIPYEINFDRDTGETSVVAIKTRPFEPDEIQKRYFIAKWVQTLMRIDPLTIERDLTEGFKLVRGKGINEFKEYISKTQPIKRVRENSTLTRSVEISNIQFLGENIAQVRVVATERTAQEKFDPRRYNAIVHFVIDPPKTEAEMYANPIGLRITHFDISEDLQ
jgi:type IV secretory pathway component VirB8